MIICRGVIDNCKNCMDSYGEICVGCNCCGRIDPNTALDCIINTNIRHIKEFSENIYDIPFEDFQKRNFASTIISFAQEVLKAIEEKEKQNG